MYGWQSLENTALHRWTKEATMPLMAKKRGKPKDQHRHRNMIRLPDDLYQALKALAVRNGRPLAWEARMAVVAHLKASGEGPPPDPAA
jgi:plasmid stability protein